MEYIKQTWNEREERRFMEAFHKNKENGCWEWTRAKDNAGYGFLYFEGKTQRAHRVFYSHFKEPVPVGKNRKDFCIDHICRNTSCCNPEHLRIVSSRENSVVYGTSIVAQNARKTHCIHGHLLKVVRSGKRRDCPTCDSIAKKRRMQGDNREYWLAKGRANVKRYYERQKSKRVGACPK